MEGGGEGAEGNWRRAEEEEPGRVIEEEIRMG